MAKTKTTTSKALAKWDEELAKQAEISAKMEANAGGGQFFSTKGGILSWQDMPFPNNQAAVIILDSIIENVFYEGAYDPDNPTSPTCYAYGRDDKAMKPFKDVVDAGNAQHNHCAGCPNNDFGTAPVGKGKACKNTRRLAMIPAGDFSQSGKLQLINDDEHFKKTPVGYMKLPVTSVRGYAGFVKQVAGALRRPPHGIVTKVRVQPDPKNQYVVIFEAIQNVPDDIMGIIMERHEEASRVIEFPYPPMEERPAPRGKQAARAVPHKQARKY